MYGLPPSFDNACHHSTDTHTRAHTFCSVALFSPYPITSTSPRHQTHIVFVCVSELLQSLMGVRGHLFFWDTCQSWKQLSQGGHSGHFLIVIFHTLIPQAGKTLSSRLDFVFGMTSSGNRDIGCQWISVYEFLPLARCPLCIP